MFCSFLSIRWVSSCVLSIWLIWSFWYSKRTEFTFGWWQETVARGGDVLDVLVFLLNSLGCDPFLWFFWRICYLAGLLFMNNGTLKGNVYIFPSLFINNCLTPLLFSINPMQYHPISYQRASTSIIPYLK